MAEEDGEWRLTAHPRREERVAALLRVADVVEPAPEAAADPEAEAGGRREQPRSDAEKRSIGELLVGAERQPLAGGEKGHGRADQRADDQREDDVGDGPGEREDAADGMGPAVHAPGIEQEPEGADQQRRGERAQRHEGGAGQHHRQRRLDEPIERQGAAPSEQQARAEEDARRPPALGSGGGDQEQRRRRQGVRCRTGRCRIAPEPLAHVQADERDQQRAAAGEQERERRGAHRMRLVPCGQREQLPAADREQEAGDRREGPEAGRQERVDAGAPGHRALPTALSEARASARKRCPSTQRTTSAPPTSAAEERRSPTEASLIAARISDPSPLAAPGTEGSWSAFAQANTAAAASAGTSGISHWLASSAERRAAASSAGLPPSALRQAACGGGANSARAAAPESAPAKAATKRTATAPTPTDRVRS